MLLYISKAYVRRVTLRVTVHRHCYVGIEAVASYFEKIATTGTETVSFEFPVRSESKDGGGDPLGRRVGVEST